MSQPVPSLADILNRVRRDQDHGSRMIACHMLQDLERWAQSNQYDRQTMEEFLTALNSIRPAMSVFAYLARELSSGLDSLHQFPDRIAALHRQLQDCDQIIGRLFNALCQDKHYTRVLTHSRSSTVETVLRQAGKEGFLEMVYCTESRPGYEGLGLARSLCEIVPVTLITDTNIMRIIPEIDCVILGADAVDALGNIRNKVGSRMMALLAREEHIPVIVLADKSKWLSELLPKDGEEHDPAELGHGISGITVLNTYFESIEQSLITTIISDKKEEE
ncbi:MAG: hypothetical protein ACE5D8_00515 [Fidelibacterota bacterium]